MLQIQDKLQSALKIATIQEELAQRTIQLHNTTQQELQRVSHELVLLQQEYQSTQTQHQTVVTQLQQSLDQQLHEVTTKCQNRIDEEIYDVVEIAVLMMIRWQHTLSYSVILYSEPRESVKQEYFSSEQVKYKLDVKS